MAANAARILDSMIKEVNEAKKSMVYEHFALNHAPGMNQLPFEDAAKINDLFVRVMEQFDQLHVTLVDGLNRLERSGVSKYGQSYEQTRHIYVV